MTGTVNIYSLLQRRVLVTRESARSLQPVLTEALATAPGELALDFSGVEGITPSFVDETLGVLQGLGERNDQPLRLRFLNLPTRLSQKFAAIGRGRNISMSEPQEGVWAITIQPLPKAIVVKMPGIRGGDPIIKGTRITVTDIVRYAELHLQRAVADEKLPQPLPHNTLLFEPWRTPVLRRIKESLPHLSEEQIMAAWNYFCTHTDEISRLMAAEAAAFPAGP